MGPAVLRDEAGVHTACCLLTGIRKRGSQRGRHPRTDVSVMPKRTASMIWPVVYFRGRRTAEAFTLGARIEETTRYSSIRRRAALRMKSGDTPRNKRHKTVAQAFAVLPSPGFATPSRGWKAAARSTFKRAAFLPNRKGLSPGLAETEALPSLGRRSARSRNEPRPRGGGRGNGLGWVGLLIALGGAV